MRSLICSNAAHLVAELHADPLQGRSAGAEPILDHPLDEVLGEHRRAIVDAAARVEPGRVIGGHARRDAIHHAAGEGDVGLDPGCKIGIACGRERQHAAADHVAIVLEIVAGTSSPVYGPVPAARTISRPATMKPNTISRHVGNSEVVGNFRRIKPELAGLLVQIVAAFGDGQGDDPGRRVGEPNQ